VDPIHSDALPAGGRPSRRTWSPQRLLDEYERHAAARHRSRSGPVTKESFCAAIGRTKPTLKHYLDGFGFLWPLVPSGRLVALAEASGGYELLWVSTSLCELLGYTAQDLLDKTWLEAFRPGEPPNGERLEMLQQLRRGGCVDSIDIHDTHLTTSDGRWLDCHAHTRYGPESDTLYTQLEPLGEPHAPPIHEVEILNVEPGVRWIMHPLRDGSSRVVRLDTREELLEMLERRQQPGLFDPTVDL
jgi:PAS domain S-box-containing protein